jgi:uncharacterized protein
MHTTSHPAGSHPISDLSRIAQDLQIRKLQVENVVQLLDEGNTVPFISRFRKERTGGLSEDLIRRILERVDLSRRLNERKQTILKSIDAQGKLTDALKESVLTAENPKRLEDLYLPFKPKKKSLAAEAQEKGLGELAAAIWNREPAVANLAEIVAGMVNPEKQLNSPEEVLAGVKHILAERIAETAEVRSPARHVLWDSGELVSSKAENVSDEQGKDYRDYFAFKESVRFIPPHRILAVNRGERENILKVKVEFHAERMRRAVVANLPLADHPHRELLETVVDDAIARLLVPSLEREVRRELTEAAQDSAVHIFARNLRSLLLQPPLKGKRVLAIDPGLRTGCKLAALDEEGKLLGDAVIHPHAPQNRKAEAKSKLEKLIRKHQTEILAIGNGTACRETEQLVSELIAELGSGKTCILPDAPPPRPVAAPPPAVPAANTPASAPESPIAAPAPVPSTESTTSAPATTPPPDPPAQPASPEPQMEAVPQQGAEEVIAPPQNLAAAAPPQAMDGGLPPSMEVTAAAAQPTPAPEFAAQPPPPPAPPPEPLPDAPRDIAYVIVNEAGASDYSTSPIAREEFPGLDATTRATISIGRRLQDPLAELVKIEPQHVGVGLYQHDVRPKHLKESLEAVIESCVNEVGVDLNNAGVALLRHISGLNQMAARDLVEHRAKHGPFRARDKLKEIASLGETRFAQVAGFLRIADGDEPLDATWIHPENYPIARQLLTDVGSCPADLRDAAKLAEMRSKFATLNLAEAATRLGVGEPSLHDILDALVRPGRDPRDDRPAPIFKKGMLKLEDLQPGMELKGTVLNVVPFGAFVDIGLKDTGLVHISQMANRYIKNPYEVVAVGDVVTVWVLKVEADRRRASLTMIAPGSERKPPERRPQEPRAPRPPQGERPPQGDRGPRPPRPPGPPPQRVGGPPVHRGGPPPQRGGPRRPPTGPPHAVPGAPGAAGPVVPPQPPPPPRKPSKPKPLPKLSQEALKGKTPLHTFGELEAFFKAKEAPPPPPPAAPPANTSAPPPPAPAPPTDAIAPPPPPAEPPAPIAETPPPTEPSAAIEPKAENPPTPSTPSPEDVSAG